MYETEEQQVEALKKWWKENGKSIIAGVVLGLGGVAGWGAWVNHKETVAKQASNVFEQMVLAVEADNAELADAKAKALQEEFAATPYSAFADLMQARVLYQQGDPEGAKAALERAIANAPDPALKSIAVLRLARIRLSSGEVDAAEAALNTHPAPAAFTGEYAAAHGDIARARGDLAAARSAYERAIAEQAGNSDMVQLKLENLPPAS